MFSSSTVIFSVTPAINFTPSIVTSASIASEFSISEISAFLYSVAEYFAVSYWNITV